MNVKLAALGVALFSAHAAAAEPMQLKFANPGPPKGYVAVTFTEPWVERVNKAADGAIDVKMFAGPSLGTYQNIYDRTTNGIADMAFGLLGPISSQFPKTTVPALPFATPSATAGSLAMWDLIGHGILGTEWDGVKPLALMVFPNVSIHSRKPIAKLEDMHGLKISSQSRPVAEGIERLGAGPVTMAVSELYQSLQRGTIDAATIGWPAVAAYKLAEVSSYHINVPLGSEVTFMVMNKDSYAKLPDKGRAVIDNEIGEKFQHFIGKSLDELDDTETKGTAAKPGQSVTSLSRQEFERWKERTAPVTESWIKATPDGARVLEAYRAAVKKYDSVK